MAETCITIAIPGPILYAVGIAVGFFVGALFGYTVRGDDNKTLHPNTKSSNI